MTTITPTVTVPAAHPGRLSDVVAAERTAGRLTTAGQVALRTVRQFARTPQLLVVNTIQGAMFLLIFRYVFGGAIDSGAGALRRLPGPRLRGHERPVRAAWAPSAGVAEDVEKGFFDRLRSLPVSRPALLGGRALADTALLTWGLLVTTAVGFSIGFRIHGSVGQALAAFGLCVVYGFAFTWLFVFIGLVAGNAQAAQGMSLLVFPLTFVSSAYVPVDSMPGLDPAGRRAPAAHDHDQRGAVAGPRRPRPRRARPFDRALGRALARVVGGPGGRVRPAGGGPLPADLITSTAGWAVPGSREPGIAHPHLTPGERGVRSPCGPQVAWPDDRGPRVPPAPFPAAGRGVRAADRAPRRVGPERADRPFPQVDGQGDPELSTAGREQAIRVAERLEHEDISAIYVTTLQRTAQTAAPLAARLGLEPRVERDLREVFLGEWEGSFRRNIAEGHPTAARVMAEGRWDVIPGAEPDDEFRGRVHAGIARIAAAHPDECVVIVAHGGVIGSILTQAAGSSNTFAFVGADNGSISHVVVTPDRWIIRCYNDTSHLGLAFSTAPEPLT